MNELQHIEVLFNSVEVELASRWIFHDVPAHFVHRPVEQLRQVVKAQWHIYQESMCAGLALDRTIWERGANYPAGPLDTLALIDGLEEIHRLIDMSNLLSWRPLTNTAAY